MEHRFLRIRLILISFTVITDILFYLILKHFLPLGLHNSPLYLNLVFWIIPMLFVLYFLFLKFDQTRRQPSILANLYTASGLFLTIYLPKIVLLVFHLTNMMLNLVWRGLVLTLDLFLPEIVTYRTFHFITYAGLVAAGILFLLLVYGALIGRFSFKIEKVTLGFANLPVSIWEAGIKKKRR